MRKGIDSRRRASRGYFKGGFLTFILALAVIAGICALNYFKVQSHQKQFSLPSIPQTHHPGAKGITHIFWSYRFAFLINQGVVKDLINRLAQIVRIPTISYEDINLLDESAFLKLQTLLESFYPKVYSVCKVEKVGENNLSLLITWEGTNKALRPMMLTAHFDVVPIDESTKDQWTEPPFGAHIHGDYLYGRGTMDDKSSIIGILEACEWLISEGFNPTRTIIIGFGHDEEVNGYYGAREIAELLKIRNIRPLYLIDEGMLIAHDLIPGIPKPVAIIGVTEKGWAHIKLTVSNVTGGHSSMPPQQTAVGILAKAVANVEANPLPSRFSDSVTREMLEYLAAEMTVFMKVVIANIWLFGSLINKVLQASPVMNAGVSTTTAVTMISGGIKLNVLPSTAVAHVNHRIINGDSFDYIINHHKKSINDDRVKVELVHGIPAAPISKTDSFGFATIEKTIKQIFPETVVAPGLMIGNTDTRWYWEITDQIFRFMPLELAKSDLSRIHGVDERISVQGFSKYVEFYRLLILNSQHEN